MFQHIFHTFLSETTMERDTFMSPEEAKDFGIIDNVLDKPPVLDDKKK
jgi:ATP-dependent protease ClpP protease subunit